MHLIETLPKRFTHNDNTYFLEMHVTAFNRLCLCYKGFVSRDYLCSVVVEPENEPKRIEKTTDDPINNHIGNARNFDDAVTLLKDYIINNFNITEL